MLTVAVLYINSNDEVWKLTLESLKRLSLERSLFIFYSYVSPPSS